MGGRGGNGTKNVNSVREMSILAGSEKQVKWANDIRNTLNKIITEAEKEINAIKDATKEQKKAVIAHVEAYRNRINSAENAGDIINLFKDIRYTSNPENDLGKVLAVFRVAHPMTEGERKIIGSRWS